MGKFANLLHRQHHQLGKRQSFASNMLWSCSPHTVEDHLRCHTNYYSCPVVSSPNNNNAQPPRLLPPILPPPPPPTPNTKLLPFDSSLPIIHTISVIQPISEPHRAATSLILYSTTMGWFSSTMKRPEPTYILSCRGLKRGLSASKRTWTTNADLLA